MKHKRGRYEETTDASHMCNAQCAILNQLLRSMQRAFLKIFEGRISNELKEAKIKTNKRKKKENNISKEKQISHKKMEEASNIEKQRKEMTRLTLCNTYLLWLF